MSNENYDLEKEKLELEKQKLELEKQKLQINQTNGIYTENTTLNIAQKQREIKGIKNAAIWSIAGLIIFIFPGIIAAIILFVKLLSYKGRPENNGLRIASAILIWFFIIIGAVCGLVYASKESSALVA